MKLGIGTAQFGMCYGATNNHGQCTHSDIQQILQLAQRAGIDTIDTAAAYGASEQVLGNVLVEQLTPAFRIVTKLPASSQASAIKHGVQQSLVRLHQDHLYGLLTHQASMLLGEGGEAVWHVLVQLKEAGMVKKIGASVYTGAEIEQLLEKYPLDLIQLPINLFDQRLVHNGLLQQLKRAGVEIHARSVFLQGIILSDARQLPQPLSSLREKLTLLQAFCHKQAITPLQAALAYVWHMPAIDRLIIGASSPMDFSNVLKAVQVLPTGLDFSPFMVDDNKLLNPSYW